MITIYQANDFVPLNVPQNMNGKFTYRICIKKDHVREDGTCAIYLAIYYNGQRKRVPLNISVPLKYFDVKKQRVKSTYAFATDYNLLIEKILGNLNTIEINYRLNDEKISIEKVLTDLNNPSLRIDFNKFAEDLIKYQLEKGIIKKSTHKQQASAIEKFRSYKNPLLFSDINSDFINEFRAHLKKKLQNKPSTVEGTLKNFKKFLHEANSKGIRTAITFDQIKVSSMEGDITFLLPGEVKKLYEFYNSGYINETWKNILQRYLFSCFTGLRISDIERIKEDNFLDDFLVYTAMKTEKLQKIKLNQTAKELVTFPHIFNGSYTREYINRELKEIAKACGIKKRLYFHSSRHTFATNYLIAGGQVQNLQKLLGHSKIETTMIYVHAVESITNKEMILMDGIVKDLARLN